MGHLPVFPVPEAGAQDLDLHLVQSVRQSRPRLQSVRQSRQSVCQSRPRPKSPVTIGLAEGALANILAVAQLSQRVFCQRVGLRRKRPTDRNVLKRPERRLSLASPVSAIIWKQLTNNMDVVA